MKLGPKEIKEINQYLITGRNKQREFVTDDDDTRVGLKRGGNFNPTGVNQHTANMKTIEEIVKVKEANPELRPKNLVTKKLLTRDDVKRAQEAGIEFPTGKIKKKGDNRNKDRLELSKKRSSPSLETKLAAPKKSKLNFHHAGFKESLTDLKNTMYIPGSPNRKMAKLFEDPLLKEMETFTKVFDNPKATTKQKQKAATNYLKNDRALRQKYPEFKDFKTRLSFKRTSLDPSGIMFKEKLRDPSLAISQEPGMTLKGETPSTPRGKEILKKAKQSLETVSDGPTLGMNLGLFRGLGEAVKAVPTPLGTAALTAGVGVDPKSSIDRASIAAEAAFAPQLVQQSAKMGAAQRFFNLGLPAKTALRLARLASPIGIAALGAEGLYQAGKFTKKRMGELKAMSPEQRQELRSEGARQAFDPFMAAGGGIAKEAGDPSGRPPESGPQPQGLLSLKNRVRNY